MPPLPLRLTTLGGLAVTAADGTTLPTSPPRRRLALLALIASSGARGISRERLLLYFWPDGDEERSRHALTQTLYALRRDLGGAEVFAGTADLRVIRESVQSDIQELDDALARGDRAAAVALYAGPFLDGVHVSGLPEFERWVEEERARIARRVASAAEELATEAEQGGDPKSAERWWRVLAALDPHNPRYAIGLMRALAALGDRSAALRHARVYDALARDELGVEPDPAVAAYAAKLSEIPAAVERAPEPPRVETEDAPGAAAPEPEVNEAPPVAPLAAPLTAPPVATSRARGRLAGIAAVLVAVAVLAYGAARLFASNGIAASNEWVLVTDFENATGDSVFNHSLAVALSAGLQNGDRVSLFSHSRIRDALALMERRGADTLVDESLAREIAARAGIRLLVVPAIARIDSTYVLSARIVDAANGEALASEEVRAQGRGRIIAAIDDLSRQLRHRLGESRLAVSRSSPPLPLATTSSLEALRLYADGVRAFDNGEWDVATRLYRAAVERDTGFALARARLGVAYYWLNKRSEGEAEFQRALASLDRLSDRERLLIRADVAGARGDRDEQINMLRAYLARYPQDAAVQSQLAYAYYRSGRLTDARAMYLRILGHGPGDRDATDWVDLAETYDNLHDPQHAAEAFRHAFALDSAWLTRVNINNDYGRVLVELGRVDDAHAVFASMLRGDATKQMRGLRSLAFLAMYRGRLHAAADDLQLSATMARVQGEPLSEARARLQLALVEELLGAQGDARRERDSLWSLARSHSFEPTMLAWIGVPMARSGELERARVLLDSARRRSNAKSQSDRAAVELLTAEIASAEHHDADARAHIAAAMTVDSSTYVLESAAMAAERRGDLASARALFARADAHQEFGWEAQLPWELAPYHMARVLAAAGDTADARASFARFVARWPGGDSDVVPLADARRAGAAGRVAQGH